MFQYGPLQTLNGVEARGYSSHEKMGGLARLNSVSPSELRCIEEINSR